MNQISSTVFLHLLPFTCTLRSRPPNNGRNGFLHIQPLLLLQIFRCGRIEQGFLFFFFFFFFSGGFQATQASSLLAMAEGLYSLSKLNGNKLPCLQWRSCLITGEDGPSQCISNGIWNLGVGEPALVGLPGIYGR